MARRFRGEGHQKVDAKGRVSVPALFRRVIQDCDPDWSEGKRANLVIVYGTERQNRFNVYTIEAIEEIDRRIDRMKKGSPERKYMERIYHGHSLPTQLDDDGRVQLPQKLREKLGLKDSAFFIASGDHFQIWNPATYEAEEMAKTDEWLAEQDPDFDPDSLLPELPDDE